MKNTLIYTIVLLSNTIGATTYYISTSGSNSNNGSKWFSLGTLAYACTRTTAGDVNNVGVGTFNEGSNQAIVPAEFNIDKELLRLYHTHMQAQVKLIKMMAV